MRRDVGLGGLCKRDLLLLRCADRASRRRRSVTGLRPCRMGWRLSRAASIAWGQRYRRIRTQAEVTPLLPHDEPERPQPPGRGRWQDAQVETGDRAAGAFSASWMSATFSFASSICTSTRTSAALACTMPSGAGGEECPWLPRRFARCVARCRRPAGAAADGCQHGTRRLLAPFAQSRREAEANDAGKVRFS
jgi:hypothetical protein